MLSMYYDILNFLRKNYSSPIVPRHPQLKSRPSRAFQTMTHRRYEKITRFNSAPHQKQQQQKLLLIVNNNNDNVNNNNKE